jgi:hypothetical protein
MSGHRKSRTYRVQRIPAVIEQHQLGAVLAKALDDDAANIEVCSLAPSLNDWEQVHLNVATVIFKKIPSKIDDRNTRWSVSIENFGIMHELVLDTDFLGFTPLNYVQDRDLAYTSVLEVKFLC